MMFLWADPRGNCRVCNGPDQREEDSLCKKCVTRCGVFHRRRMPRHTIHSTADGFWNWNRIANGKFQGGEVEEWVTFVLQKQPNWFVASLENAA